MFYAGTMVTTAHQDPIIQRSSGFLDLMRQGLAALTTPSTLPQPTVHQPAAAVKPNANKNLELILKTLAGLDEKSPERLRIEHQILWQQQRIAALTKQKATPEQALQSLLQNPSKAKALQRDLGLASAPAITTTKRQKTQAAIDKIARGQELNTAGGLAAERKTAERLAKNAKLSPQQANEIQKATSAIDREASQRVNRYVGMGHASADPSLNLKRVHQAQERGVNSRHVMAKKSRD